MDFFLSLVIVLSSLVLLFSGKYLLLYPIMPLYSMLTVQAWFAFLSRRGSRLRREVQEYFDEFSFRPAFGRSYLRTMDQTGGGMSEQIELQNMLEDSNHEE